MEVSWNRGTPSSHPLIAFSIINRPLLGTPIYGTPNMDATWLCRLTHLAMRCHETSEANFHTAITDEDHIQVPHEAHWSCPAEYSQHQPLLLHIKTDLANRKYIPEQSTHTNGREISRNKSKCNVPLGVPEFWDPIPFVKPLKIFVKLSAFAATAEIRTG